MLLILPLVPFESIAYVAHDTARVHAGGGSHSGRSMKLATTVVGKATDAIIEKGRRIAGHLLETGEADLEFVHGLYRVAGNDHQEVDDHELLDLLESPNEHMTGIEFKYTVMAHLELTGNFYGFLDGVRDETSRPRAIYPLNPGRVRVKLNKSSFPYKLSHYEFTIDGNIFRYEPYQVLHIKYPDPNDPFVGIGVPQVIPLPPGLFDFYKNII